MSRGQRIIAIALWAVLLAAMVGVVAGKLWGPRLVARTPDATRQASAGPQEPLPVLYPAAQFTLTDQDNKPFSSTSLRGRPWVAAFIFTTCSGICPVMTQSMSGLQPKLPPGLQLVTVTVNPSHDTPAVLKQYAAEHKADESRWRFLTGSEADVYNVAVDMKLAPKSSEGVNPLVHSEKLILIDADGNIRGYYNGTEAADVARLAADAASLTKGTAVKG